MLVVLADDNAGGGVALGLGGHWCRVHWSWGSSSLDDTGGGGVIEGGGGSYGTWIANVEACCGHVLVVSAAWWWYVPDNVVVGA